jgi:hypothetical protein
MKKPLGVAVDFFAMALLFSSRQWLLPAVNTHLPTAYGVFVVLRTVAMLTCLHYYWQSTQMQHWSAFYPQFSVATKVRFFLGVASFVLAFFCALGGGFLTSLQTLLETRGIPNTLITVVFWSNVCVVLASVGGLLPWGRVARAIPDPPRNVLSDTAFMVILAGYFVLLEALLGVALRDITVPVREYAANIVFGFATFRLVVFFRPPFQFVELLSLVTAVLVFVFGVQGIL